VKFKGGTKMLKILQTSILCFLFFCAYSQELQFTADDYSRFYELSDQLVKLDTSKLTVTELVTAEKKLNWQLNNEWISSEIGVPGEYYLQKQIDKNSYRMQFTVKKPEFAEILKQYNANDNFMLKSITIPSTIVLPKDSGANQLGAINIGDKDIKKIASLGLTASNSITQNVFSKINAFKFTFLKPQYNNDIFEIVTMYYDSGIVDGNKLYWRIYTVINYDKNNSAYMVESKLQFGKIEWYSDNKPTSFITYDDLRPEIRDKYIAIINKAFIEKTYKNKKFEILTILTDIEDEVINQIKNQYNL
jgi:hypothetical protein